MTENQRTVSIRFTDQEYEELCQKAKKAGYRQIAPFIKDCIAHTQLMHKELEGSEQVCQKMDELIGLVREKMYVKISES